jgi:glycosyltransferase involved in cell wall biosynthesis
MIFPPQRNSWKEIGMLVSIITPVLNGQDTIGDTLKSIAGQSYPDIEYIVVDNGSTDATLEIVKKYGAIVSTVCFERQKGIYHAMNKGIHSAHGGIIGVLNADDCYAHNEVIGDVVRTMGKRNADVCWGNLVYVDRINLEKVIRYWKSRDYTEGLFERGWMPPHPTFFVRNWVYEKHGVFDPTYRLAADYELMLRLLHTHGVRGAHIPEVLVKMRIGGMTNRSVGNLIKKSREDYRALRANGLRGGLCTLALKNISKIPQFFRNPLATKRLEPKVP